MNSRSHVQVGLTPGLHDSVWTSATPQPAVPHTAVQPPPAQPTPPIRLTVSVAEAAELLGVSDRTIRRLIDRRLIRPSRALRHLLIPRWEIERFLRDTTAAK